MRLHLWKTVSIITRYCIFEDKPAIIVQTCPSGLSTVSLSDAPVEPSSFWLYAFSLVNCRPKGAGQTIEVPRSAPTTLPVGFALAAIAGPTDTSRATAHFGPQMPRSDRALPPCQGTSR